MKGNGCASDDPPRIMRFCHDMADSNQRRGEGGTDYHRSFIEPIIFETIILLGFCGVAFEHNSARASILGFAEANVS